MHALSGYDGQSQCGVQLSGCVSISQTVKKIGTLDEFEVWSQYESTQDIDLRHALYFHYDYIARDSADWIIRRLPYRPLVEPGDVHNDAAFGLLKAIDDFTLDHNTAFATYATTIVRGRIYDGIRNLQDFPRRTAQVRREIKPLIEELWHRLGRKPSPFDLKEHYGDFMIGGFFGMPLRDLLPDPLIFAAVFSESHGSEGYGEEQVSTGNEYTVFEECLQRRNPNSPRTPSENIHREWLRDKILKFLSPFPEEQMVIYRYFFMEMTSEKIAKDLKKSSTWVSDKKTEGLRKLRKAFRLDEVFANDMK